MGRSPCCDKSKVKRGTWSPEEDEALKNYLAKHGTAGNWIALPHKAGLLRCGKSCRLRWLNYLRPDIRHGAFTQEESDIICNLYNRIGSRWSVIASHLQGRTDNDVKNYWNTKIKKKLVSRDTNLPTQSSVVASSSTTTTPAAFQASTFTLANEDSSSFTLPKFSLEGSNDFTSAYSSFPLSTSHQGSTFFDSFGLEMGENYGGNGETTDEGFGDYGTADLFSIFQC